MPTILLQDTEKSVLEILTIALELEGFEVYSIRDFKDEFLSIIERQRPHVVVLDYRLNGKDCVEALKQIKKQYPHLPVIATSCNNNIHEEYNTHGFDDYIRKPFDLDLLYTILRKYIKDLN